MKVKMIQSQAGSPDGISVVMYRAGEIYDLNDSLSETFVKTLKVAEAVVEEKMTKPVANKMVSPAENKAVETEEKFSKGKK